MPTLPTPGPLIENWTLDRELVFLNHGSFGATPRLVQQEQQRWRERLEREPVRFFVEEHMTVMDDVRVRLAAFLKCAWDELALVPNATVAVATVMHTYPLRAGDELLISEHEYPACRTTFKHAAARAGAEVVYASIPFPIRSADEVVQAYVEKVTPRTRLALVSHVTSPTGLVYPVERIVAELQARGVDCLVDGAHAPGMIPTLDIGKLAPAYYTANCHKWICSPKGSAFLYVRSDKQGVIRPLALSNHAENGKPGRKQFLTEFDFLGTQDYTSLYCIPRAIDVMGSIVSGWPEVMTRNHDLCLRGRRLVCNTLGVEPPAPEGMIGSIATIILPAHDAERTKRLRQRPSRYHDALQDCLIDKHRIQVPIWGLPNRPERFVRISAQLYNSMEQYEYLVEALKTELAVEGKM